MIAASLQPGTWGVVVASTFPNLSTLASTRTPAAPAMQPTKATPAPLPSATNVLGSAPTGVFTSFTGQKFPAADSDCAVRPSVQVMLAMRLRLWENLKNFTWVG